MAGFSNVAGMLDSVEMYVASTPTSPAIPWALATTTLPAKRLENHLHHTCF